MASVIAATIARACLDALTDTGAPFDAAKVRLLTNGGPISPEMVWADLTEATFDGYAPSATLVWGAAYSDGSGNAEASATSVQFNCTGNTTQEVITGLAITTGTSPVVLHAAEIFDAPVNISGTGDAIIVVPTIGFPGPGRSLVSAP